MKILGIDPGLNSIGYGVIDDGRHVAHGYFVSESGGDLAARINAIGHEFNDLIHKHKPDLICIEEYFSTGKNSQGVHTSKVIGRMLDLCHVNSVEYKLYSPMTLKSAIGGKEATARKRKDETKYQSQKRQKKAVFDGLMKLLGENPGLKFSMQKSHCSDALGHAYMGFLGREGIKTK